MKRILLSLLLVVASSVIFPPSVVAAESCREFNFKDTFNFGYNAELPTWNVPGSKRVITWAALNSGEINGKKIQRSFGTPTQDWLREAFQSWDDALDSISFKEVSLSEDVDIKIGWTQVLQLDYESLFNFKAPNGLRSNATIEFKHQSTFLIFKENFIQAAQSDIGHILGMGYISPSSEVISVMEWPFQAPYAQVPLGEFDVALIRAIYSESTCASTFNPVIQASIKAKQEAELKAKQEAEAKAAAELKAKQEAEAQAAADKAALAKAQAELLAANAALADSQKVNRELQSQLSAIESQFKLLSDSVTVIQGQVSQLNSKLGATLSSLNSANAKLKKVCSAKPKPKGC
jgi:chemotaxis protein histidine kinase CheA